MKKLFFAAKLSLAAGFMMVLPQLHATQNDSIARVIGEFRQMQKAYLAAGTLSYSIKYQYTSESDPSVVLDSLSGEIEMSNEKYRYVLDSMETIKNEKYTIILFREDKVMYLSKPAEKNFGNDPLIMFDSTLTRIPGLKCYVHTNEELRTISFDFPPGLRYKKIDLTIDTVTGLMTKATYLVKTGQMMPEATSAFADRSQYEEYGRIAVTFFNYSRDSIDNALFDEKNYFSRNGKEFSPADRYRQYKIFIASPNL